MPKTIVVYPHEGGWAFDDAAVGLKAEPFVQGADTFITDLARRVLGYVAGRDVGSLRITFDAASFPEWQTYVFHDRPGTEEEGGGDWYNWGAKRFWLCPALLKYFTEAPQFIFVRVDLA